MATAANDSLSHAELEHQWSKDLQRQTTQTSTATGQVKNVRADEVLEDMGYVPELIRTRSTFHVVFMPFVLASVPYGLATSLFYPLINGGPRTIIWGWVLVSAIIICVASSLGEITSVYPTAGGVKYQTFMLSPVRWRRLASWICGWSFVVGNIIITLAVNFGTTMFLLACINVFESEPGISVFEAETYQVFLIFLAITLLRNAVSVLGNRWLSCLDVSIFRLLPMSVADDLDIRYLLDFCSLNSDRCLHFGHCEEWTPFC
jgi:amino acid permease